MANCQSCTFFLRQGADQGLCRRSPPSPIPTENGVISTFPPMLNEGWCGEHIEKESNK